MGSSGFVDVETLDSPPISPTELAVPTKVPHEEPRIGVLGPEPTDRGEEQVALPIPKEDVGETLRGPDNSQPSEQEDKVRPWDRPGESKLDPSRCVLQ